MNYNIIIPAKNEAKGIKETLKSIVDQTIPPKICLVIDDGSTDGTADIIKDFEKNYSNIKYFKNNLGEKLKYSLGGHVVEVFNIGIAESDKLGFLYDYTIKMDADISFEPDFMERIFKRLEKADRVGIVSGTPYYLEDGYKKYENSPDWHTHGQFKIYNNSCLKDMNGLKISLGWDTADNIVAMAKGWKTLVFRDINYKMSRKVGGKSSLLKGRINHGIGCYLLGYNLFYLFLKIFHDMFKAPYFTGSMYLLYGYCKAGIQKYDRILSKEEVRTLRKLLWKSFFRRLNNRDFIIFQQFQFLKKPNQPK